MVRQAKAVAMSQAPPPSTSSDGDVASDISDATVARLLRVVASVLVLCVVIIVGVAGTRWILAPSREEPLEAVDVGFLQDMIDHHEQAIVIANTYLANNADGGAAPYAREVPIFQGFELERMDKWLSEALLSRGAPNRVAMTWMSMGTPVSEMPGMQTPERIAELGAATGREADRLFFEIMSEHHSGGAHMADFAGAYANKGHIREFAEKMAYNQRIEVVEYDLAVKRLGL